MLAWRWNLEGKAFLETTAELRNVVYNNIVHDIVALYMES